MTDYIGFAHFRNRTALGSHDVRPYANRGGPHTHTHRPRKTRPLLGTNTNTFSTFCTRESLVRFGTVVFWMGNASVPFSLSPIGLTRGQCRSRGAIFNPGWLRVVRSNVFFFNVFFLLFVFCCRARTARGRLFFGDFCPLSPYYRVFVRVFLFFIIFFFWLLCVNGGNLNCGRACAACVGCQVGKKCLCWKLSD